MKNNLIQQAKLGWTHNVLLPTRRPSSRRRHPVIHGGAVSCMQFGSVFFLYIQIPITQINAIGKILKSSLSLTFSPANDQASVIQSGTRNLLRSTHGRFRKHVCGDWIHSAIMGQKDHRIPPKNRPLKAFFMSGLWGESNGPKDGVERGFSTCYRWGHIPKDPIGQGLNKPPSTAD